jgi:glyoxylase-like metal-dependent hydrolase (beta-lactamase superfamily II)
MQVVPGIEYVDETSPAHVYLLDDGGEITLIDAGLPDDAPKVLAYLERTGRKPSQVKRIVLTHRHGDHAGAVAALVAATGAEVFAHPDEAGAIASASLRPGAQTAPLVKEIKPLQDGDVVPVFEGLRAVHTPGHTAGHLCLYLPERKVLFTGDAMLNRGGVSGPNPQFTPDLPRAHASLRERIAPLEVETLCVAHGDVIAHGAGPMVRAAIAALAT